MKIKKLVAFLTVLTVLALSGCNGSSADLESTIFSASAPKKNSTGINVLYSSKDTLDPFTCITKQNDMLTQLIYDPLVVLDNDFNIRYKLAENVEIEGNLCKIKLKTALFSDGSPVTAKDVVFSFGKAKASTTTPYAASLKYAKSAIAENDNTVTINLIKSDPFFANLLTFPIMKTDSDKLKDVDNRSLPPIGAGKYVFSLATASLTLNKNYYGKNSAITEINTVDCPDNEAVMQAVKAGMVDIYYSDLIDNQIPKMNGNTADINQNVLVFLGVNEASPFLKNSYFRQAISAALNREVIADDSYHGKAEAAIGPFPSFWKSTFGYMSIEPIPNAEIAINNINLAGYTKKDKAGYFVNQNNKRISLSLVVNSENAYRLSAAQNIADNLTKIGIEINIKALSLEDYYKALRNGQYDLYLGEVRMENNMDLGGLVYLNSAQALIKATAENDSESKAETNDNKVTSSKADTGSKPTSGNIDASKEDEEALPPADITLTSANAYKGFYSGIYSLQDLITAFTAELPVIPVCFKKGLVIYSDRFEKGLTPSATSLFDGI